MDRSFAFAIHGGAGTLTREKMTWKLRREYERELLKALEAGIRILEKGGSGLDAVEAAVIELEDCPFFNAGKGSVFNFKGDHEMDAALMDGRTLAAGAVAGIRRIKNPVCLARAVLERGEYVLLCGAEATAFAEEQEMALMESDYFHTDPRHEDWLLLQKGAHTDSKKYGTVGAVAFDKNGHLAAATSTGGLVNKRYGRVGDSCIIGGGTYANDATCAVSCTGEGEQFIRAVVGHDISCLIDYQMISLNEACERALSKVTGLGGSGGLIAIDRSGAIAMPFTTDGMYRACYRTDGKIEVGIFREDIG